MAATQEKEVVPGVKLVGRISHPKITESSGIIPCSKAAGVFWTHNDGHRPVLYAITRHGDSISEFHVIGANIRDWEDISTDHHGHLFIGDIGNNDAKRDQIAVYQINEPDPKSPSGAVQVTHTWQLRFPKKPFDCESLFVYQGYGYVISKVFNEEKAAIYRFPLTEQKEPEVLEIVAHLKIETPVTGACLSSDARLLGIVTKSGAFVYEIDGKISRAAKRKPFYKKFRHEHIEACCFVPEGLLATSEGREIFLFTDESFRTAKP